VDAHWSLLTFSQNVCLCSHEKWKLRYLVPALGDQLVESSRCATCISVCISVCLSVQPNNGAPAIGSRTWATMANKCIGRAPRFSAHSDRKHSMDLPGRADQTHPIGMVAIGSRTGAAFAKKLIARRPRLSAHSGDKHSKHPP